MQGLAARVLLAAVAVVALALSAAASIFAYNRVALSLQQAPPPLVFLPPTSQASATIGPNNTSLTVVANLTDRSELLVNPDFYTSADPWLCGGNSPGVSCYWLSSDTGSSGGVVVMYGTVNGIYNYTLLAQNFTVPVATSNFTTNIRYALPSDPGLATYLVYGILWWNGTAWQSIGSGYTRIRQTTTYTTYVAAINTSQPAVPGQTYRYYVGYLTITLGGTIDFRVDWAMLNLTTPYRVFAGDLARINSSVTVYARFYVTSVTGSAPDLNLSIYLVNLTSRSTPVTVINGNLTRSSTSWIRLEPPPSALYTSGSLYLTANSTVAGETLTLKGFLEYTNGVYYVFYPVTVTVNS